MRSNRSSSTAYAKRKELTIGALVVAVLLILGVVKILLEPPDSPEPVMAAQTETPAFASEQPSTILKARAKVDAQKRENALAAIAEHEQAMGNNWNSEDTPDLLMAVGNLHQYQLDDYYSAIKSYRTLVDNYPDHNKTAQAYIEMAACYKRLGDEMQARYVYKEMVETMDPSLQHVQYAKMKIDGE